MQGLEQVYRRHHTKDNNRKRNHAILAKERSNFIKRNILEGSLVLDIGCRDGELIKFYNNNYTIFGLDIDSEALEIAKNKTGISVRQCDLNGDWDVESEEHDAVVACEVIEHLYHPEIVFKKIYQTLKPGGVLAGSVPHAFNLQTRLKFLFGIKKMSPLADPTHINHFTHKEIQKLLECYFQDIEVVGVCTSRYKFLQNVFPFMFAHTLLFKAKK
jgi:2-polyprenyl-3-methyl-5-hydroxy-6-metoxy-1,4-benzoquinol methylase